MRITGPRPYAGTGAGTAAEAASWICLPWLMLTWIWMPMPQQAVIEPVCEDEDQPYDVID